MAASFPLVRERMRYRISTITSVSLVAKLSGAKSSTSVAPPIAVKKPVTASFPIRCPYQGAESD